jgi:hypothetical protein
MIILNRLNRERSSRDHQRGIALLMALIALLIIGAITAGAILLSNTETSISSNFRDEQLAFFSAKAGIEEARDRMQAGVTNTLRTASLPTTLPGTTGSVLYILNPANGETVAPWNGSSSTTYPDDEICKETSTISCSSNLPSLSSCNTWCASTTASSVYAASPVLPWKWVRLMLKQNNALTAYSTNGSSSSGSQVCWNGTNEETTSCTAPNQPVYTMTALAVTPTGSRRMVQAEISEDRLNFNASAALTLDGTGDTASMPSSNNFGINGNDTAGCGVTTTGAPVPSIGVGSAADVTTLDSAIPNNRKNNYTGSGSPPNPDVENIASSLPPSLQTVTSLQNLTSSIKTMVTQPVIDGRTHGAATGLSSPGTAAAPQIIYVNGDLTLSGNVTGYGILVVTGTFTASGNVGWNGLVLVVGQGNFQGNGGGNNSYNGAILVAKTLDSSYNPLASLGSPTFGFNGGGGNGFNYSSGCIAQATTLSTFHIVAFREMLN